MGSHVYKVTNANPPKPGNPTNVAVSSQNLGIGDGLTISWANTANATSYRVNLVCTTNSAYSQSATVGGTSASFSLRQPGFIRLTLRQSIPQEAAVKRFPLPVRFIKM